MELPLKLYLSLYIIELMMIIGISNLSSQVQVMNAQNFAEDAVAEIENSNYNANVINSVISQAQDSSVDYSISVTLYKSDATSKTFTSGTVAAWDTTNVSTAEILVSYHTQNKFLGYDKVKEIRRYIR